MTLNRANSLNRIREIKRHIASLKTVRPYINSIDELNKIDQEIEACKYQINEIIRQQKVRENWEVFGVFGNVLICKKCGRKWPV